jgi:hypothetical protein
MLFEKQAILGRFYSGSIPQPYVREQNYYFKHYQQFLSAEVDWSIVTEARCFLESELGLVEKMQEILPPNIDQLKAWSSQKLAETGQQYHHYLERRHAGAARVYFPAKAHALIFLQKIEPTKSVDGSWLYTTIRYWQDPKYYHLIQIYLEELGYGVVAQNHVALYKRLLQNEGIQPAHLPDAYYRQASIQLAFSIAGDDFLPEMIGFNLAYEQTPLHLLISTYELNELGIDPYYFSLHITVDNAASGHGRQACDALFNFMPLFSARQGFYHRVRQGAKLNNAGISSNDIISAVNLYDSVVEIFKQKAVIGQFTHNDHCRIEGKSLNEWLASPACIPSLIQALQTLKWVRLNENPLDSRFWQLISGDRAVMKGVFNQAELQVIFDWIAGCWVSEQPQNKLFPRRYVSNKPDASVADIQVNADITELKRTLKYSNTLGEKMEKLIPFLSPALHSTDVGLWATRQYTMLLNPLLLEK